eukprot:CAMPEP_0202688238 /NCGR_PEP_ID=MMETSP1385-20130828/3772_1 /ASSEMBLY_ACC=CAM_ASM_000861 /TAXON_ID=933848 /ORGANISM="Elphidium margaritaceum" /LENGTH=220 /DNA_ID=CAMNT_0049343161 /DNA_START=786 /DNA_END=1448 /DNA_ORIENTATION=+
MTGVEYQPSYRLVFQWMMSHHQIVTSLVFIGVIMGTVLFMFWAYHFFFLAMQNSTTNENHKYSQLKGFMNWRFKRIAAEKKEAEAKQAESSNATDKNETDEDGNEESTDATTTGNGVEKKPEKRYMFADFDMKHWNTVNVYDKGWWRNLYYVYYPYADINVAVQQEELEQASNGNEAEIAHSSNDDGDDGGGEKHQKTKKNKTNPKKSQHGNVRKRKVKK